MNLPYENATSGATALSDISKMLTNFGCQRVGTMTDNEKGCVIVQFTHRERDVSASASYQGYAAAWLRAHPYSHRTRSSLAQHQAKALAQAKISVCSILRDWIKGQVTAVECGILSFEGAFLGQIMLPSGETVLEKLAAQNMLPKIAAPETHR
jgi:hypothetical protein